MAGSGADFATSRLALTRRRQHFFVAIRLLPLVDPIRRPHLAAIDQVSREAIERDIGHCRTLLGYLRGH